jgi:hypothetical protein
MGEVMAKIWVLIDAEPPPELLIVFLLFFDIF